MTLFNPINRADRFNGAQKSAILFLCLGEERGGALMQQLGDSEIRQITKAISGIGEVPAELVEQVMDEFGQKVASHGGISGSIAKARGLLTGFMPEDRVNEFISEIESEANGNLWGDLSELDDKTLAGILNRERDQTAAVILSRLNSNAAARVLPMLGADRAVAIIERILSMDDLQSSSIKGLEESLRREVLAKASRSAGAETERRLVSVFNKIDGKLFEVLAAKLEKSAPEQFQTIRQKMFVFADLAKLPPPPLAKVMREVSGKTLPLALRGAEKPVREHFLESLPARSRDMLQDEMKSMGPVRSRDVKQAQSELVDAAMRLVEAGEIQLPSGEDEDMID